MATTITQARPLLTAAELQLFDQSRAEPIKALTLARLRGKVTRTRALRDKYRDLYRRQTVAVRSAGSTKGRSPVGVDNRTERKAEILQEVLGRFEARIALLQEREEREAAAGGAAGKTAARKSRSASGAAAKKSGAAGGRTRTRATAPANGAGRGGAASKAKAGRPAPRKARAAATQQAADRAA